MSIQKRLYDRPGHLIRRAHQLSMAIFAQECGSELTAVQYAALVAVAETPGVDATRLAALIAFDRSTIGDVLERLESKDWIERRPAPSDKRIKLIYLTAAGANVLADVEAGVERTQARLLASLSPSEQVAFVRLLKTLTDDVDRMAVTPAREVR